MTAPQTLEAHGRRRLGSKERGFRYVLANGRPMPRSEQLRIRDLRLPPAWTDVRIGPDAHAGLQAVSRDKAGRWQYRYHPEFVRHRERRKYARLVRSAEALPKLRATVLRDLARPDLSRACFMACIGRILSTCFLRLGSAAYADEHGSYGIATLRRRHVKVRGDVVEFDFEGKSGKRQQRLLHDRDVARVLRRLLKLPGHEVFK